MSVFSNERSKPWNMYNRPTPSPSQAEISKESTFESFGTSMSAISFGFVATAILISMFLIMAIFEHLFKPNATIDDSNTIEARQMQKLGHSEIAQPSHAPDISVMMPGQQYPTFIAQPAPLPCERERVHWPTHGHSFA